jgi:hypothetical protein
LSVVRVKQALLSSNLYTRLERYLERNLGLQLEVRGNLYQWYLYAKIS